MILLRNMKMEKQSNKGKRVELAENLVEFCIYYTSNLSIKKCTC
jgi:hypothetical protein